MLLDHFVSGFKCLRGYIFTYRNARRVTSRTVGWVGRQAVDAYSCNIPIQRDLQLTITPAYFPVLLK